MPTTIVEFQGDYRFLSNFWVLKNGLTVEHHYQAAKAVHDKDRDDILACATPGQAKRLGSKIKILPNWDHIKDGIMLKLVRDKFSDPRLAQMLLDTGDFEIIEGNKWHDNYWGSCNCPKCEGIPGKNKLGKILMQVRSEIAAYEHFNDETKMFDDARR